MLFKELIGLYCENNAKYINELCAQHAEILISKQMARVVNGQIEYVLQFKGLGFEIRSMHVFNYLQVYSMKLLRVTKPVICSDS
jgi:hypothetical protein